MEYTVSKYNDALDKARNGGVSELLSIAERINGIKEIKTELINVPEWEGVSISDSFYEYGWNSLTFNIDKTDRPWRGLNGVAGIVYQLRKLFNVSKFNRSTSSDGSTKFFGYGKLPVSGGSVYFIVNCRGQMPDNCTLVEYRVMQEVTTYKSVCGS